VSPWRRNIPATGASVREIDLSVTRAVYTFVFLCKMFLARLRCPSANRLCSVRYAQTTMMQAPDLQAILGKDLHWECRTSAEPVVIIDIRPAEEYKSFHVIGTISLPFTEAEKEDFSTIPKERSVFVFGGDKGQYEAEAISVVRKIAAVHPCVKFVRGGPDEIRQSGFLYSKEVDRPANWE